MLMFHIQLRHKTIALKWTPAAADLARDLARPWPSDQPNLRNITPLKTLTGKSFRLTQHVLPCLMQTILDSDCYALFLPGSDKTQDTTLIFAKTSDETTALLEIAARIASGLSPRCISTTGD